LGVIYRMRRERRRDGERIVLLDLGVGNDRDI
jgi:hypothetical protein